MNCFTTQIQAVQANLDKLHEYDIFFTSDDAFIPIREIAMSLIASATFTLETMAVRLDDLLATDLQAPSQAPLICEDQMQRLSILAQYPIVNAEESFVQSAANGELSCIRMLRELGLITIDTNILFHSAIDEAVKNGHVHIFRELIRVPLIIDETFYARMAYLFEYSVNLETMEIVYNFLVNVHTRHNEEYSHAKSAINRFLFINRLRVLQRKVEHAIDTLNIAMLRFMLTNWHELCYITTFDKICRTNNSEMIQLACDVICSPPFYPKVPYLIEGCKIGCISLVRELIQKIQILREERLDAMIIAIRKNHPEILRILLSAKTTHGIPEFNPNFKNNRAIRTAIYHGKTECIRVLLEFLDQNYIENKALVKACARGEVETVRTLLMDPTIDPSAFRNSALRMAVKNVICTNATTDIVHLLLEDPRFKVTTAVDHCINLATGHTALVELLTMKRR